MATSIILDNRLQRALERLERVIIERTGEDGLKAKLARVSEERDTLERDCDILREECDRLRRELDSVRDAHEKVRLAADETRERLDTTISDLKDLLEE